MSSNRTASSIKSVRDLLVWQKAYGLALMVYRYTKNFPKEERYGLTSQVRRAAVSIFANIGEGSVKGSREFVQHLIIARGSLEEAKGYFLLAKDLDYLLPAQEVDLQARADEIGRMIQGLKIAIKKRVSG